MPAEHDGESAFTFELRFSDELPGAASLQAAARRGVAGDDGKVTRAKRVAPGQNLRWEISVRPDSYEDVTIVLPAATECGAAGSVCTEAGSEACERR